MCYSEGYDRGPESGLNVMSLGGKDQWGLSYHLHYRETCTPAWAECNFWAIQFYACFLSTCFSPSKVTVVCCPRDISLPSTNSWLWSLPSQAFDSLCDPYPPLYLSCILHQVCTLPRPPVLYTYPTQYLVCPHLFLPIMTHMYLNPTWTHPSTWVNLLFPTKMQTV